jgi:broad specificity phosphatase PhoE
VAEALYLIRHGKTKLNGPDDDDRIRGWIDIPLDKEGIRETKEDIAPAVEKLDLDYLVSSDLKRAEQSAKIISEETGVPYLGGYKEFRPWHLGEFSGKSSIDAHKVLKNYVLIHPDTKVPGGESFEDFYARALKGTKELLQLVRDNLAGNVGVVTHYRILKLTAAWIESQERGKQGFTECFFNDDIPTGSILKVFYNKGKLQAALVGGKDPCK